jgi:UDP-glucose 4-epimerase
LSAGRSQKALVTGAAGFIGSHLADRLAGDGWSVTGLDDGRTGDWARVGPKVGRVERALDSLSEDEFLDLCRGVDVVFHLAAEKYNSSRATPQRVIDVNVSAARALFDAAGVAGAKVVFTSSLYAYGALGPEPMRESDLPAPSTVYGASKVAGEHLLRVAARDRGLRWTVGRLFFVYGPKQYAEGGYKSVIVKGFERIRNGEAPIVFGDGEQALDYVFVDDCVDALLAMAGPGHDGATYNVSTGRAVTVNEVTRLLLETAGSELEPTAGPADWTAGTVRAGDAELARRGLGWSAGTPLADGLGRIWDWLEREAA